MSKQYETAADRHFLSEFECQRVKGGLDHLGHIRLSWLYLNRYDINGVLAKICCGIKTYAESQGATEKFHLTISHALVHIMARRRQVLTDTRWETFLHQNADIVKDFRSVLHQYYSEALLGSEIARTTLVEPDLKPLS